MHSEAPREIAPDDVARGMTRDEPRPSPARNAAERCGCPDCLALVAWLDRGAP